MKSIDSRNHFSYSTFFRASAKDLSLLGLLGLMIPSLRYVIGIILDFNKIPMPYSIVECFLPKVSPNS